MRFYSADIDTNLPKERAVNNIYLVNDYSDKKKLFRYRGNKYIYTFYKLKGSNVLSLEEMVLVINRMFFTSINIRTRLEEILIPRRYAYFLSYRVFKHGSYNFIGKRIAQRNHASVLNQVRRVEESLDICDRDVVSTLASICNELGIFFEVRKIENNTIKEV